MKEAKTILVTGGAGFIGSHLCEHLAQEGHRVISLDNYFTGSVDNHVSGVEYRTGHTKDVDAHVPESPDVVYHLGEYARVEQSVLEPEVVHDLNTVGTRSVIEFWRSKNLSGHTCKLIYAGSSTKFGDEGATRYTSPYAQTKAENSEHVRDVGEHERLPYAITYFYNVYGERERSGVYGTVIEHFKRMYLSGAPSAIVSPGTQRRNFTHVADIVDALVRVGEGGAGDEYGIGNEQSYSILDVAQLFGFGDNTVFFPVRPGNRMTSSLDTSKTSALGWHTKHNLPEYIRTFVDSNPRGEALEKRVLVFSTTMHPVAGLAEDAFLSLAKALPDVTFDVITTRFTQDADKAPSPAANIIIHRVGTGTLFDKFLLPIVGPLIGLSLFKKRKYLFTWSLMASYAGIAGLFLKTIKRNPFLITLADQNLDDLSVLQRWFFSFMLSRADQVYGTHGAQEARAMDVAGHTLPRNTLGEGDAFANALRYAYADIVRQSHDGMTAEKSGQKHRRKAKKVLIFSLSYYPKYVGGAEVAIKEITDRISPSDIEFHMITLRYDSTLPKTETIGNVIVHRIGITAKNPTIVDLKRWPLTVNKPLYQLLAAWKALWLHQIYHFDATWAMMAHSTGVPAAIFKMFHPDVKYILNLQEGDPIPYIEKKMRPVWPFFTRAFTLADVVQPLSSYLADWARARGFKGPMVVIPNAVNVKHFSQTYPATSIEEIKSILGKKMGDVIMVTTSRLVRKNAVDDVIRALPLLPGNVFFAVLGNGPDETMLKKLAADLHVSERVRLVGHIAHDEMPKYLKASDIFIRPSRSEGFGASFMEAMAAEIPIIATQEGGIADFLFDEKRNPDEPITGWAVSKDSPQDIATAVIDIMSHPEKVHAVTKTARALVEEKYDWDLIARDMQRKVFDYVFNQ